MENSIAIVDKTNFILKYLYDNCSDEELIHLYNQSCMNLNQYQDMIHLNSDKFVEFTLGTNLDNSTKDMFLLQYNPKDQYVLIDEFGDLISYANERDVLDNVNLGMIAKNIDNLYMKYTIEDEYNAYILNEFEDFKENVSEDRFKETVNKFIKHLDNNNISKVILENYSDYLNEENKNIDDRTL